MRISASNINWGISFRGRRLKTRLFLRPRAALLAIPLLPIGHRLFEFRGGGGWTRLFASVLSLNSLNK